MVVHLDIQSPKVPIPKPKPKAPKLTEVVPRVPKGFIRPIEPLGTPKPPCGFAPDYSNYRGQVMLMLSSHFCPHNDPLNRCLI